MVFKLALLLSVETLVLIAALFLLVYITKQQVSKWFTYGTSAIIIAVLAMMLCSVCCTMCMRHHMRNEMNKECMMMGNENCRPGMMMRGMHPPCPPPMMNGEDCCKQMKGCNGRECEEMEGCEMKEHGMHKRIMITTDDSMPKKEIIIKKK